MKIEDRLKQAIAGYLRSVYRRRTNLATEMVVKSTTDDITVSFPDYIDDIQRGRRAGEQPIPMRSLLQWMLRAGIPNSTVIAYRIQQSIIRKGIKPKNILGGIDEVINDTIKQFFEVELDDKLNLLTNKQ